MNKVKMIISLLDMIKETTNTSITFRHKEDDNGVYVEVHSDLGDVPFRSTILTDIALEGIAAVIYENIRNDIKPEEREGFDFHEFVDDFIDKAISVKIKHDLITMYENQENIHVTERKEQKDNG